MVPGVSERPLSQSNLSNKTNGILFLPRGKNFTKEEKSNFLLQVAFESNIRKSYQGMFTNIESKSSYFETDTYERSFISSLTSSQFKVTLEESRSFLTPLTLNL